MDRKSFIKTTCTACTCTGIASLLVGNTAQAEEKEKKEDWRIGHMQRWAADIVNNLDAEVDEKVMVKLLEACGRSCAQSYLDSLKEFKGNLDGYLAACEKKWHMTSKLSKDKTKLTLTGKKSEQCGCPLGQNPPMQSKSFCNCSNGWMKETLEMVTGKKVDVELKKSIIRSDGQCEWEVRFS